MTYVHDFAKPLEKHFSPYRPSWLCKTSLMCGKISLDITAFDDSMVSRYAPIEYDPDVESLADFIEQKFGLDARLLVSSLITGFPKAGFVPPAVGVLVEDCL